MEIEATLRDALGDDRVTAADDIGERYLKDWSGLAPGSAALLVRPRSVEEVAATLRHCHAHGIGVVPQGGMTGISGGGRPRPGELILSLDRLRGVESIDPDGMTMQVWAGTPLEEAQNAAAEAGLLLPLDLGARGSCLIGGNLSTNAGGNRVIRYGMSRGLVLGLEVVLADGTVVEGLNHLVKNNAGYDLKQVFIGSEGTLGVITRAVLRLEPQPASHAAALCGLESFEDLTDLLRRARRRLGHSLTAFEAMWRPYLDLVVDGVGRRLPLEGRYPFYALVEMQGMDADADAERFEAFLAEALEADTIEDAAVAQSAADVAAFWGLRDAVADFPHLLKHQHAYDIGLPIRAMPAYTEAVTADLKAILGPDAIVLWFGHLGDGNLHLIVARGDGGPMDEARLDEAVYLGLRAIGGTVTAEHGVGTLKQAYLGLARNRPEIDLMRRLKATLDPKGILNPAKVLPPD